MGYMFVMTHIFRLGKFLLNNVVMVVKMSEENAMLSHGERLGLAMHSVFAAVTS
jgi:hypothetical protein